MKVVINDDWGGFRVSKAVFKELGLIWDGYGYLKNKDFNIKSDNSLKYRSHESLIKAIEKIGLEKSTGKFASLKIIEIPDYVNYIINNNDGIESIHEVHRIWS